MTSPDPNEATSKGPAGKPDWKVRPYQEGDAPGVVELFNATFPRTITEEQYRWKLVDAPWPLDFTPAWLAEAGGRIVGQYAGTPMRFKMRDREDLILHGCDVMTAADYRGRGVLTAIGDAASESWKKAGIPFMTGLHYGGWGSRRHYLGWREQFKGCWLWCPLRIGSLIRQKIKIPAWCADLIDALHRKFGKTGDLLEKREAGDTAIEAVDRPGAEFDDLWNTCKDQYEALVIRDRTWVTYRYAGAPGFDYRILLARRSGQPGGYLAYRTSTQGQCKTGWIADLFSNPEDLSVRVALLNDAVRRLYDEGCAAVRSLVPKGTGMQQAFQRAGFRMGKGDFDISIVPFADPFPYEVLKDPNRWFTMGGDFDVV